MAGVDAEQAEAFDEGALADAGRPRDPDSGRSTGERQEPVDEVVGPAPMVGPGRFDQGDASGQGAPIPGLYSLGERVDVGLDPPAARGHGWRERTISRTSAAAFGMLVPGPKMAPTPAARSMS